MMKLSWIEFFLRTIPETLILIWGIQVIARKSLNIGQYIFSSMALSVMIFGVRYLPIYYGVHTEICIILTIGIMFINGIPLTKVIQSTFLIYFLLSLSESINMIILSKLNLNTNINILEPITKCLYGIPSLIILIFVIVLIDYVLKKREDKNVFN